MKKNYCSLILSIITLALCTGFQPVAASGRRAQGPTQKTGASASAKVASTKMARLLDASGYKFTKAADNIWFINFQGKSLAEFKVTIVVQDEVVVMFTILAEGKDVSLTPILMKKLLSLNHAIDRVKIALGEEGELVVRTELSQRVVDVTELKLNVEQLSGAVDEIHAAVKADLTRPAK